MWSSLIRCLHTALDSVLPDACVLCRSALPPWAASTLPTSAASALTPSAEIDRPVGCPACIQALPKNLDACVGCALPIETVAGSQPAIRFSRCGPCSMLDNQELCICALTYQRISRHLIHKLKFQQGEREAQAIQSTYTAVQSPLPQLLLPVPLSRLNLAIRGYNQAALLGGHLSKRLQTPMDVKLLARRHAKPQRKKTKSQRQRLPLNTFQLNRPLEVEPPIHHVAIVDDVMTTGRTTQVLRQVLHNAGIQRVDIWCAARVV